MGRRSAHTADELRRLVLDAAEQIIENGGLGELSARQVARRIGYSPGTLYNLFQNLDDVILHVEARMLTALDQRLAAVLDGSSGEAAVRQFARAYHAFSRERPGLWNLLLEHHLPRSHVLPQWYQERLEAPIGRLEAVLAQIVGAEGGRAKRSARALWAGLHGVTLLSTTTKAGRVMAEATTELIDELVEAYLAGLKRKQAN